MIQAGREERKQKGKKARRKRGQPNHLDSTECPSWLFYPEDRDWARDGALYDHVSKRYDAS